MRFLKPIGIISLSVFIKSLLRSFGFSKDANFYNQNACPRLLEVFIIMEAPLRGFFNFPINMKAPAVLLDCR